jgi:hypothetical protein
MQAVYLDVAAAAVSLEIVLVSTSAQQQCLEWCVSACQLSADSQLCSWY